MRLCWPHQALPLTACAEAIMAGVILRSPNPSNKSQQRLRREAKAKARFDIICGDWRGTDPDFVAVRLSLTRADLGVVRLAGYVDRAGRSVRQ